MLKRSRVVLPVAALALVAVFAAAAWLWLPRAPVFATDEAEEAEATVWPPRPTVEISDSSLPDAGHAHPLLVLAERSPDSAWQRALALGESPERARLLEAVAKLWLARNPRSAMVAFEKANDGFVSTRWVADKLGVWAEANVRAALEWALRDAPSKERESLVAVAHATLSVAAPEEAAAYELGNRVLYDGAYWERLRELLGDDPRALTEWMARQPDERLRVSKARAIARLYGEADPIAAAQWASALPSQESAEALGVLLPFVVKQDFGFAEAIVLSAGSANAQTAAAGALLGHWPEDLGGPAGAYQWAAENLPPVVRREATAAVFLPWGKQDPFAAASAWENIIEPDERLDKGFNAVLGMWTGRDQDTRQQLHERMIALDRVYPELASITPTDPQYLFIHSWLFKPPANATGREGESMAFDLHRYWKERDPSRAAKYKDILENYDGPPPPEQPTEHREQWAQYAALLKAGKGLRHAWKERMGQLNDAADAAP